MSFFKKKKMYFVSYLGSGIGFFFSFLPLFFAFKINYDVGLEALSNEIFGKNYLCSSIKRIKKIFVRI